MKILDFFREIPKLFDWYFTLPQLKRISLNYIVIIALLITLSYYNDKQHRDNYAVLSSRIDSVNDSRAKEQEKYTTKLEYYTEKFNHLLEMLLQKKEQDKINQKL